MSRGGVISHLISKVERDKSMSEQFARSAFLYGQKCIEKLIKCRVAVFGLGGVGGICAESLCRAGLGEIDVIDGDTICITNINRQVIATHATVGLSKAKVMGERLREINPNISVHEHNLFYLPEVADSIDFAVYDYIIDAVDTVAAKLEIISRASKMRVPVISAMGAANKTMATAFEVADIYATSICPLAKVMRKELRKRGVGACKVVYSKEIPCEPKVNDAYEQVLSELRAKGSARRALPASNSFSPPIVGLIIASEVVADLCAAM